MVRCLQEKHIKEIEIYQEKLVIKDILSQLKTTLKNRKMFIQQIEVILILSKFNFFLI